MKALLLALLLNAGSLSDSTSYKIDTLIGNAIADSVFCGAVVEVVHCDSVLFRKAYGCRTVIPEEMVMKENAIFDLASISKCVGTTIAALQLMEQGRLAPSDIVSKYIPEFSPFEQQIRKKGRKKPIIRKYDITVRDLMYHVSGLPATKSADYIVQQYGTESPSSLRKYLCSREARLNRPGSRYRYSCLGYLTLQMVIEKITGERLCDYVQREVFDKLGLKDTRYLPGGVSGEQFSRIVPTETCYGGNSFCSEKEFSGDREWSVVQGRVHDPLAWRFCNGNAGNAGVFSTADDLAAIASALMNGGSLMLPDGTEHRILKPETVNMMCQGDSFSGRTMGWDRNSRKLTLPGTKWSRENIICHTGYTGPSIVINMKNRTAIILMCSRLHPENRSYIRHPHSMLGNVRACLSDIVASEISE